MKAHMRAVVDFLKSIGATEITIANGGRHPRVVCRWQGEERYRAVAGTPKDPDEAARKAIEEIRRDLGLVDHEKRVGQRRPRAARKTLPAPSPPILTAPPLPDWRNQLSVHPHVLRRRLDEAWQEWWRGILARVGAV